MKFIDVTPNLMTPDITRSLAFYRDVLGFRVNTTVPEQAPFVFVWLQRDDVSVFLNDERAVREETPDVPMAAGRSGVALFIVMEGIAEQWAQVKDRAPVVMPLKDQWYGMTEFSVADPDGYVVTFAERREAKS
jgi:catechol 2,3-dioxygenase-like lactoylglutathione lyase family enzyme